MILESVRTCFPHHFRAWRVGIVVVLVLFGAMSDFGTQASASNDCPTIGSAPAVKGTGKFYHSTCETAELIAQYGQTPFEPIAGCKGVLDYTPLTADNQEARPIQDPVWTCTGPFTLGRNTCYNPSGQITGKGTVACTADFGAPIGMQTITFTVTQGIGGDAGPLPQPAVLSARCAATQNVLTWVIPLPAGSTVASINKTTRPPGGTPVYTQIGGVNGSSGTYTDTSVQAGYSYEYAFKNHVSVKSNVVTCPPGGAAATPTPVYPLLQCAPINQTVALKQIATVTAAGGSGTYQWNLTGSGVQQGGTATSVDVSYTVSGQKVVRVTSGGQTATCVVTVTGTGGEATPTPAPTPTDTCTGVGCIETGPGNTVISALILAAGLTLLYTGYTRSPAYRRREADAVSRDQGPMDFRS